MEFLGYRQKGETFQPHGLCLGKRRNLSDMADPWYIYFLLSPCLSFFQNLQRWQSGAAEAETKAQPAAEQSLPFGSPALHVRCNI